jgi:hypothetical protein
MVLEDAEGQDSSAESLHGRQKSTVGSERGRPRNWFLLRKVKNSTWKEGKEGYDKRIGLNASPTTRVGEDEVAILQCERREEKRREFGPGGLGGLYMSTSRI